MWGTELAQLRRSNTRALEGCAGEDESLIRQISGRLAVPQISEFEQQVVVQDLLDMARQARQRESSLAQALGMSPLEFCRSVVENARHSGWAGRFLGAVCRFFNYGMLICLSFVFYWLLEYDRLLMWQDVTGQVLPLRGRDILLFPWWMPAIFAGLLLIFEVWHQWLEPKLTLSKFRWLNLLFYGVILVGFRLMPLPSGSTPLGDGDLLALPIWQLALGASALFLMANLFYRGYLHRLSLCYTWRREK